MCGRARSGDTDEPGIRDPHPLRRRTTEERGTAGAIRRRVELDASTRSRRRVRLLGLEGDERTVVVAARRRVADADHVQQAVVGADLRRRRLRAARAQTRKLPALERLLNRGACVRVGDHADASGARRVAAVDGDRSDHARRAHQQDRRATRTGLVEARNLGAVDGDADDVVRG